MSVRSAMIRFTTQPPYHSGAQTYCPRCQWANIYYNLAHHVRVRQEHHV